MRIVIQRVKNASVTIDNALHSSIGQGLLVLVGITQDDTEADVKWLAQKTVNLRIFDDENGVMNLSVMDVDGEALVVSQFTLMADCRRGNRPSYIKAARHEISIPLYEAFCKTLSERLGKETGTGEFGAMMDVELLNDGPVTIILDSKDR